MTTTLSNDELRRWASIKRADEAHAYDFSQHGNSAPVWLCALARETLELREMIAALTAGSPIQPGDKIEINPDDWKAHAVPRRHEMWSLGRDDRCMVCGGFGSGPCPGAK